MLAVVPASSGVVEVSDPRRAEFIKTQLLAINKQASSLIVQNGTLLREYKGGGYFKEDGFESFDQAIEAMKERGQLDYGARQARHFIAIVDMIEILRLSEDEVRQIGISKLREAASVKDVTEQRKLVEAAKSKSVGDIQKAAKQIRDKAAGRDTDPLDPITLMMTETQKQFYKQCIEAGRTMSGMPDEVPDVAVLVDVILADWFSGVDSGLQGLHNSNVGNEAAGGSETGETADLGQRAAGVVQEGEPGL